jgi:hypothetical protein
MSQAQARKLDVKMITVNFWLFKETATPQDLRRRPPLCLIELQTEEDLHRGRVHVHFHNEADIWRPGEFRGSEEKSEIQMGTTGYFLRQRFHRLLELWRTTEVRVSGISRGWLIIKKYILSSSCWEGTVFN